MIYPPALKSMHHKLLNHGPAYGYRVYVYTYLYIYIFLHPFFLSNNIIEFAKYRIINIEII